MKKVKKRGMEAMWEPLQNMVDLRKFLRRFGLIVYTGDRLGDLELMEEELSELHRAGILEQEAHLKAKMLIQREKKKLREGSGF